jgi:crotonobetainyl-CoA:carnitine CoA-transferase CaiB-like acyl-CoA transferase
VIALLEDVFATIDPDTLLNRLLSAGVPAGRIRNIAEVYEWDQAKSQGLIADVQHPSLGSLALPGSPLRFFMPAPDGDVETTPRLRLAPPLLGADNHAVREWVLAESLCSAPAVDGSP